MVPTLLAALLARTTLCRETMAPIPSHFSLRPPLGGDHHTDPALKLHRSVVALLKYCWIVFKFLLCILVQQPRVSNIIQSERGIAQTCTKFTNVVRIATSSVIDVQTVSVPARFYNRRYHVQAFTSKMCVVWCLWR